MPYSPIKCPNCASILEHTASLGYEIYLRCPDCDKCYVIVSSSAEKRQLFAERDMEPTGRALASVPKDWERKKGIIESTVKGAIRTLCKGTDMANEKIREKTGFDTMQFIGSEIEKEEQWAKQHPVANVFKQLAKGTLKGLFGNWRS